MRTLSSAEKCRRVWRRMFFMACVQLVWDARQSLGLPLHPSHADSRIGAITAMSLTTAIEELDNFKEAPICWRGDRPDDAPGFQHWKHNRMQVRPDRQEGSGRSWP